jgi:hypothetical protein
MHHCLVASTARASPPQLLSNWPNTLNSKKYWYMNIFMQYIIMTEMINYLNWFENVVESFGSCSNSMVAFFIIFSQNKFFEKIHKAIF